LFQSFLLVLSVYFLRLQRYILGTLLILY
jgi:hypothetical protein